MSDSECRRVACCGENGVQFNDFVYNLVNGETYTNSEQTFTIACPEGYDCSAPSITITLPPGTIKYTPTIFNGNPPPSGSGNPWDPQSGTYEFTCGSETLTIIAEGAFTNDQINSIIAFLSQCQATQDGYNGPGGLNPVPIFTPSGQPGIRLWNNEQTYTAECPEGETGDPVTVTIPANTNSSVIAASSTPLERYLAQQALDAETMLEAAAQAESELECNPAAQCPESKSQIVTGNCFGVNACQYGLPQDYVFVCADYAAAGNELMVKAYDSADTEQLSQAFAGYTSSGRGMCYALTQQNLYVRCSLGFDPHLLVIDPTNLLLIEDLDLSLSVSADAGNPAHVEALESVIISSSTDIILIDCWLRTVSASSNAGNLDICRPVYADSSAKFYCLSNSGSDLELVVRNTSLAVVGGVVFTGYVLSGASNSSAIYTTNQKVITAGNDSGTGLVTIFVVDPATDTLSNTVAATSTLAIYSVDYDPTYNVAYITTGDSLITFDCTTEEIICETAIAFASGAHYQTAVNTTADRFYFSQGNAAGTINKYGQP